MDCSSKGPWFKSGCPLSYLFFSASVFRLLFGEWAYWCIGRVYHSKSSSGTPCWVSYMYIWDCDNQFCSCILINRVDFIKTPTAALSEEAQVSVLHVYMSVYVGMCIVWRGSRDMHVHVHVLVMYIHTCTCTCTQCLLCTCSLMMCSWISLCLFRWFFRRSCNTWTLRRSYHHTDTPSLQGLATAAWICYNSV